MSKLMDREEKEFAEKLLKISRVSKTTKGGRTISFSVLAAVGNKEGKVGIGLGKANGVPDAIRKAVAAAKKNMIDVSLKGRTIPHETVGKWGATSIWMAPAYEGTGVISGSSCREILELVGVHNTRNALYTISHPIIRYGIKNTTNSVHGCGIPANTFIFFAAAAAIYTIAAATIRFSIVFCF